MTGDQPQADYTPHPRPAHFDAREIPQGQLDAKLGVEFLDYNPARTVATMPVAGNLQPFGLLHGGASAALVESVGSVCAMLNSDPGTVSVGTQVLANHHRAARSGVVTAVGTPVHAGRSLKTIKVDVTNDDGELVCSAQLIAMTLPQAPGSGS